MQSLKKKERRQPQRASGIGGVPLDLDYVSRRIKRHLNDLERTNYTEPTTGPSAYGQQGDGDDGDKGVASALKEDEGTRDKSNRKKRSMAVRTLLLYRKNLNTLIEESNLSKLPLATPSYLTASAPPSKRPPLRLCSVCGFKGTYGCMRCGLKYCDLGCKGIHDESRCERR